MIFWMYRVDLEHIGEMYRSEYLRLLSIPKSIEIQPAFMTIVDPDMYHDVLLLVLPSSVSVVSVSAVARALLCVSCLCW